MGLSEQKKEGDPITVGEWKEVQEGIAKVNEIQENSPIKEDPDVEETFVLELVRGSAFWNARRCEIGMDSHTYHRIVQQVGERDARNCLMPRATKTGYFTFLPEGSGDSYTKTVDGLELSQPYYPDVESSISYRLSAGGGHGSNLTLMGSFHFLCGSKDATEDRYFQQLGATFVNDYTFDQYIPGKIVYVHPTKTGNVITPTETTDSFPCVIKSGPQCASWHYNTANYVESADDAKKSQMKAAKDGITGGDADQEKWVDAALKAYKMSGKTDKAEKVQAGFAAYAAAKGSGATDQNLLEKLADYFELSDSTVPEQVYRFDNRWELLVALARGNLEKYLGFQFNVERAKTDDGHTLATCTATYSGVEKKIISVQNVQYVDKGYGVPENLRTWLDMVMLNMWDNGDNWSGLVSGNNEPDITPFVSAAEIICWWLRNAYDGEGKRIPCALEPAQVRTLEVLVNNSYALSQSTALLLTVAKMVPGKKYDAWIDPALTKLSAKYDPDKPGLTDEEKAKIAADAENQVVQDYMTFSGKGPVKWVGNRFAPYSEPSEESQEETEKIVSNYNLAREWVQKTLEEESEAKAEFSFAPDAVMTVPKTSKPAFTVVDKASPTGGARAGEATASANYVASSLQKEVFGGPTTRFGIIVSAISGVRKASTNPWKTDFEEVSLSFLEVSPKLPQQLWLRLLYCCQDRTSEISPSKLYRLFGGMDYVPQRAVSYFADYLGKLNEALKYSRFVVYDGVLNTKTGQFWCSDTGEIYSNWYNINTNRKAKGPCRVDAEGVNVLYTHRMDNALFGGSLGVGEHKDSSGAVLGYVLSKHSGMLLGASGDEEITDTGQSPEINRAEYAGKAEIYPVKVTATEDLSPVLEEATFVPPSDTPIEEIANPAISPEAESSQVVWNPPPGETTTVVTETTPPDTGIVRLPIVCLPLRDKTVPPRINGPLNSKGEAVFDGADYPTAEKMDSIGYSFLVAKCCGLVEPTDTKPTYMEATYPASEDEYRPFWYEMDINGSGGNEGTSGGDDDTPTDQEGSGDTNGESDTGGDNQESSEPLLGAGLSQNMDAADLYGVTAYMYRTLLGGELGAVKKSNGSYKVEIKKQFLIGTRLIFMGTYVPKDLKDKKKNTVYLNLKTKKKKMYVQKVCVKGANYDKTAGMSQCSWGDESYPSYHSFAYLPLTGDDENDELVRAASNTTAGWIEYAYYDEVAEFPEPERFEVECPNYENYLKNPEVKVKGDEWVFYGEDEEGKSKQYAKINPIYLTPFATMYSRKAEFGSATVVDINKSRAIIAYRPSFDRKGSRNSVSYDQLRSFPFCVDGFPSLALPLLTTMEYKAQRTDFVPAICPHLDQNEVILPGTVVEVSERTITLYPDKNDRHNTVDFKYFICEPPESYSTTSEGTPYTQVLRFKREEPKPSELDDKVIENDDLWITSIVRVPKLPSCEVGGTEYYVGISLTVDGTPKIRQPYGIFNDCDNQAHLGLFIKRSVRGLSYPTSFHIDYVPYGYAVPAKTPACYYKTSGDNCAANIISPQYIIKRVAKGGLSDNFTLQLTGACYVPGSSLTILG